MARVDEVRGRWRAAASAAGVNPRDVDVLLADVTDKSVSWVIAHEDADLDDAAVAALEERMLRRIAREPLQYIRGTTEFFGRDFAVDPRVLIPRPETEHLVEEGIARIRRGATVLDIGTGSGCVAVTIALERADLRVFASDVSVAALAVASRNASRYGAPVEFFGSNVCEGIGAGARFGAILSNPPYVPAHEVAELQPEVREFEPHTALTPGPGGLEVVDRILERAPSLLESDGVMLFEIGYSQSDAVAALAGQKGWAAKFVADLQGIPRVAVLSR